MVRAGPAAGSRADHREGPRAGCDRRRDRVGPDRRYYARRVATPALAVVPMKSEPGVKFDYEMAMGVRYGESEWKTRRSKS